MTLAIPARYTSCIETAEPGEAPPMPVEKTPAGWPEDLSPFERIGMIYAAPQDSWSGNRVSRIDEGMRFSGWTGLTEQRPPDGVNRARRAIHDHAARVRAPGNGCPPHEPAAG